MRGSRARAASLALFVAARASAAGSSAPTIGLEPPPGWSDVTAERRFDGAVLALKGPESSSFVLARADGAPTGDAASALSYLSRVLDGVRTGSKADYKASGPLESRTFRNGVSAQLLRATLAGRPRLVVALLDVGGRPLVATLSSAAPEAMLTPLFGAIRTGVPDGAVRAEGVERSLDGQLEVSLGGGLRARALSADERARGVVLALQGAGSEVVFIKLGEDAASPKDQAAIVRATVADAAKALPSDVSPARLAATPAGPAAVYAWAALPGSTDLRFAAGYLPWSYLGYSLLARGPQAEELLVGALAALKTGPEADPRLVAGTPPLEIPEERGPSRRVVVIGAAAAVVLAAALAWRGGRKKANLDS
jgi:hypothetical protein